MPISRRLEIGETLHVADLIVPAGVEILTEAESVIASILAPSKATTGEEEGAEAAGEGEEAEEKPE